jgi:hypothetical protein
MCWNNFNMPYCDGLNFMYKHNRQTTKMCFNLYHKSTFPAILDSRSWCCSRVTALSSICVINHRIKSAYILYNSITQPILKKGQTGSQYMQLWMAPNWGEERPNLLTENTLVKKSLTEFSTASSQTCKIKYNYAHIQQNQANQWNSFLPLTIFPRSSDTMIIRHAN